MDINPQYLRTVIVTTHYLYQTMMTAQRTEYLKRWAKANMKEWQIPCKQCKQVRIIRGRPWKAKLAATKFCKKCSRKAFGWKPSEVTKEKNRLAHMGKVTSEETKKKLRMAAIEHHRQNGMAFPAVDKGAREYFQYLNMYYGLNIQYPNIEVKDLGYFLDGYEPVTHTVYEYDSKAHNNSTVRSKDFKRQQEIIEYYKNIGEPLTSFYRIDATGVGPFVMKDVINN